MPIHFITIYKAKMRSSTLTGKIRKPSPRRKTLPLPLPENSAIIVAAAVQSGHNRHRAQQPHLAALRNKKHDQKKQTSLHDQTPPPRRISNLTVTDAGKYTNQSPPSSHNPAITLYKLQIGVSRFS
ncbi:hypothetical protein ABFX02_04G014800 [Erythranthe guttata]